MEFEVGNDGIYCHRCGTKYPQVSDITQQLWSPV